jgi:hypothetical protein
LSVVVSTERKFIIFSLKETSIQSEVLEKEVFFSNERINRDRRISQFFLIDFQCRVKLREQNVKRERERDREMFISKGYNDFR